MRFPTRRWLACSLLVVLCAGCGDAARTEPAATKAPLPCTKFGDRCEIAPGKLGACVERVGCTGPDCFVCQSQH